MKGRKKLTLSLISIVSIVMGIWIYYNPIGKIGWAEYAITMYSAIPIPVTDFQVRSDGSFRTIEKTHELNLEELRWLLETSPDFLIVAVGWDGMVKVDSSIVSLTSYQVKILKNNDAIKLFNNLKSLGYKVSIPLLSEKEKW